MIKLRKNFKNLILIDLLYGTAGSRIAYLGQQIPIKPLDCLHLLLRYCSMLSYWLKQ